MTIEQLDTLFNNIAVSHKQLNDYAFGELWQVEEKMNKNAKYPMLFVVPVSSMTGDQVKERTFHFLILDMVNKDDTNQIPVWSDTEQILDDIIKIVRRESDDYELVGEPILFPFKEEHSDWASGYRAELVIRTQFNNNYCDVPALSFVSPEAPPFATIKDQNGNVIATLKNRDVYTVIVASGILDDLSATVSIIDNI